VTNQERDAIWIKTEPTPDGKSFVVTVDFSADCSVTLTPDQTTAYAKDVLTAVQRAEYDAAVMRQLTPMTDKVTAFQMVQDLRGDRPELAHTAPLELEPGVAMDGDGESFRPFIRLGLNGETFGQWDTETARGHALGMLEVTIAADMDAAYARALVALIGVERNVAMNVVGDLARHR